MKIIMALAVIFVSQFYIDANATADTNGVAGPGNTAINNKNDTFITIQVSSFRRAKGAAQTVSTLKRHGMEAFSRYEAASGKGMWHRVYVGRFGTRQAAKKMGLKLKAQGIISQYWIKTLQSIAKGESATRTQAPEIELKKPVEFPQQISIAVSEAEESPFSIAIKTGAVFSPNADNFVITKKTDSVQYTWQFSESKIEAALVPSYRLTESFFVEGRLERTFATELDLWYLTLGPKMRLGSSKSFSPYLRAGLTWGDLSWDKIPGDFDNSFGWEVGLGLDVMRTRYKVGLEVWHRNIQFDYNAPLDSGVTSSQKSIDLSGYVFTGSLIFVF